jgi:hypothetical protein
MSEPAGSEVNHEDIGVDLKTDDVQETGQEDAGAAPVQQEEPAAETKKKKGPTLNERIRMLVRRLGGPLTYAIWHVIGTVLAAALAPRLAAAAFRRRPWRHQDLAAFLAILLTSDAIGYGLVVCYIPDLHRGWQGDVSIVSALFAGSFVGAVSVSVAHVLVTKRSLFWHAGADAGLTKRLRVTYSVVLALFTVVPWLALYSGQVARS